MSLIAVTGSGGQLGQELAFLADYMPGYAFVFLDSDELDVTESDSIQDVLEEYAIDYLINCAAYTKVDLAESNSEKAFMINKSGAEFLARYCDDNEITMIHLSTDYVYHNDLNEPLKETDVLAPKSVYAISKLQGEEEVLKHCPNSLIFRTSWVYSSFGHNFLKTMINLSNSKTELNIVNDQNGAPTYARDLADRILKVIDQLDEKIIKIEDVRGVYNLANQGETTWYGFAKAIFELSGINMILHPVSTEQYPSTAPRPKNSVLNQTKFVSTFGLKMPNWEESLRKCLKALEED